MIQLTLQFDYDQLDTETRIVVQQEDKEFDQNIDEANHRFIQACKNLERIHGALKYSRPGFVDYIGAKGIPNATAYRMLDVAKMFPKLGNIPNEQFGKSALYLLAAPSTPDEARTEALSRAEAGERITHRGAKGIVAGYRNGNGYHQEPQTAQLIDARPAYAADPHLDTALEDENKPVCQECGQVYDGPACPDCNQSRMKPKQNYQGDINTSGPMDRCQTPPYAVTPLLPYLQGVGRIWEPAAGEGYLAEALSNFDIVISDILTGQNFFEYEPDEWGCLVTNPPYSIKYQWLERCYELGKPFALLLPVETLGAKSAQVLFKKYGVGVIFLDRRVNFKMPNKGWEGSAAQFPVAWFTYKLGLGNQIIFGEVGDV